MTQFENWIQRYDSPQPHFILDGANIGYYRLNGIAGYFHYHLIDAIVKELQHQNVNVSIILPPKYCSPSLNLIRNTCSSTFHQRLKEQKAAELPEAKALVDNWARDKLLYVAPNRDDWYWLYGSLILGDAQTRLLTHDMIRDHTTTAETQYGMPRQWMLEWRRMMQVTFDATEMDGVIDSITFHTPYPHVRRIVQVASKVIHFPVESHSWMCVEQPR